MSVCHIALSNKNINTNKNTYIYKEVLSYQLDALLKLLLNWNVQ